MYAISDMMRVSLAQYVVLLVVALLFAFFVGQTAAYSSLMAGLAYAVPNTLLAFYLAIPRLTKLCRHGVFTVFGGEAVKLLVVLSALALIIKNYENLHWPAFIFTIIAVANSYFIVLFKRN